ncbi:MAG: OmpA family protein [Desulfobacteraceae bacterium]|jgi:flagellar motor protein MotB
MAGKRIKNGLFLMLFIVQFVCVLNAWANIPADSSKELLLNEQKNLTASVIEYKTLIHEYRLDLSNLKAEREWITVKINRIEDQKRDVPDVLREAIEHIDEKVIHHKKEMKRLEALCKLHIKEMKSLDAQVKKKYGKPSPVWWSWNAGVAPWMKSDKSKQVDKAENHDTVYEVAHDVTRKESSGHAPSRDSSLLETFDEKIKEADIDNWVAIASGERGLKLEVQLPILFGLGKTDVAADYKLFFNKLASLIKPYHVVIEVSGYPDNNTSDRMSFVSNMALGTKRAANVVKELMKSGLPASAFKIISESGSDSHGREKNELSIAMKRRVEVNVYIRNSGA